MEDETYNNRINIGIYKRRCLLEEEGIFKEIGFGPCIDHIKEHENVSIPIYGEANILNDQTYLF